MFLRVACGARVVVLMGVCAVCVVVNSACVVVLCTVVGVVLTSSFASLTTVVTTVASGASSVATGVPSGLSVSELIGAVNAFVEHEVDAACVGLTRLIAMLSTTVV